VLQEPIHPRLAEARQLLAEINELADGGEGVLVLALLGPTALEDVGYEGCVPDFLFGHELDEVAVLGVESGGFEVLDGETSEAVVEEVEFDPLLVESQILEMWPMPQGRRNEQNRRRAYQRLKVEIAERNILWRRVIHTQTSRGSIWHRRRWRWRRRPSSISSVSAIPDTVPSLEVLYDGGPRCNKSGEGDADD
jgi:hypothetical protein